MSTITDRHAWIDNAKGLGIILVVYGHILPSDTLMFDWVVSFNLALFFFLSGVLYKERPLAAVMSRSWRRLMVPYFTWAVATYVFWITIGRHVGKGMESDMSVVKPLLGIFYGINSDDWLVFNRPLWFLPALFSLLLFYASIPSLRNRALVVFLMPVSVLGHVLVRSDLPLPPWGIAPCLIYFPFFVAGTFCSPNYKRLQVPKSSTVWLAAGVSWILHFCILVLSARFFDFAEARLALPILGISGVVFASAAIGDCRWLQFIGRNTIAILCAHGITTGATRFLVSRSVFDVVPSWGQHLIILLGAILLCWPVCVYTRKWAPWVVGESPSRMS